MKLDRNLPENNGRGKYALVLLRKINQRPEVIAALKTLCEAGVLDYGNTESTDFFVIRLKDKYAAPALDAYGSEAEYDDKEYAKEIFALADTARSLPNRQRPD